MQGEKQFLRIKKTYLFEMTLSGVLISFFLLSYNTRIPEKLESQERGYVFIPFSETNQISRPIAVSNSNWCCVRLSIKTQQWQLGSYIEAELVSIEGGNVTAQDKVYVFPYREHITLSFSDIKIPPGQYVLLLSTNAAPNTLFVEGKPGGLVQGDFELNYWIYSKNSLNHVLGVLQASSQWIWKFIGFFVFFYTGGFFLVYKKWKNSFWNTGIIFVGIIPTLLLGLSFLNITINIYSFLLAVVGVALLVNVLGSREEKNDVAVASFQTSEQFVLGVLLLLSFFSRIIQADGLFVPNWLDGISHYRILSNLTEQGGISFGKLYHVGFHSIVLILRFLFDSASAPNLMLQYAYWLSAILVIPFYLFVRQVSGSHWGALFASSLLVFWQTFPSYLVSWGRYPLIQALNILFLLLFFLFGKGDNKLLQALLVVGLALTHYGTFFTYIVIVIVKYSYDLFFAPRNLHPLKPVVYLIPVFLLMLLKIIILLENDIFSLAIVRSSFSDYWQNSVYVLSLFFNEDKGLVAMLAMLGLFANREKIAFWIVVIALILVGTSVMIFLFGVSIINPTDIVIFLSFPICYLAGDFLNNLITKQDNYYLKRYALFFILLFLGFYHSAGNVNPQTLLFSSFDEQAISWMTKNIDPDESVLVDSFLWGEKYMPIDGGGWIPPLSDFNITYFSGYPASLDDFADFINEHNIHYVYLGRKSGQLESWMSALEFTDKVYSNGRVDIIRIDP